MNKSKDNSTKGVLYLIPNVISEGTEESVINAQTREVISNLDYFLVENLRTARRYISRLKLGLTIEDLEFLQLDKNTRPGELNELMAPVLNGKNAGIISESGCPGIADPGSMAVDFAHRHQIKVIPVSGPSSIFLALMASGFNGQGFIFHGYLPVKSDQRQRSIRELEKNSLKMRQTQIFIETPYRNNQILEDIKKVCSPETRLCVALDISGKEEQIISRSIKDWKQDKNVLPKVPAVFLIHVSG